MKLITFFLFSNPSNLWDAEIVTIAKRIPVIGNLHRTGCMLCSVRKLNQIGYKTYQVHRFVWDCHNGLIPDGNYNWCHSNRITVRNHETFLIRWSASDGEIRVADRSAKNWHRTISVEFQRPVSKARIFEVICDSVGFWVGEVHIELAAWVS